MKHRPCPRVTHITETLYNIILSQLMYCAAIVKSGYLEYSVCSFRKKEGVLALPGVEFLNAGTPSCAVIQMTKQEKSVQNILFITHA